MIIMFKSLDEQEEAISNFIKDFSSDKDKVKKLCGYPWILKQWEGVN